MAPKKNDCGFIWMSVPKNYRYELLAGPESLLVKLLTFRESDDDGLITGILLGPLLTSALLYSSIQRARRSPDESPLPAAWLIEAPINVSNPSHSAHETLVLARLNLVNLATFCSSILLLHVCASWWFEARSQSSRGDNTFVGERGSVPRSEGKKISYYVIFTLGVSVGALCLRFLLAKSGAGIWQRIIIAPELQICVTNQHFRHELLRDLCELVILSVNTLCCHTSRTSRIYFGRTGSGLLRRYCTMHGIIEHNDSQGMSTSA
jgi:hypothetical protein